jgi:hypothetical protein
MLCANVIELIVESAQKRNQLLICFATLRGRVKDQNTGQMTQKVKKKVKAKYLRPTQGSRRPGKSIWASSLYRVFPGGRFHVLSLSLPDKLETGTKGGRGRGSKGLTECSKNAFASSISMVVPRPYPSSGPSKTERFISGQ